MGEKIKNISTGNINGYDIQVELNRGQKSSDEYDIHIEGSGFRMNMNDKEFMKFAVSILEAKRKLINSKEIR